MTATALDWLDGAACRIDPDPDAWFADVSDHARRVHARQVCSTCPVRAECLQYALRIRPVGGIWSGFDSYELHFITSSTITERGNT